MPEYVIITPVRNEDKHLINTIESIVCQTIKPKKWIIVDDGSTDGTGKILQKYSKMYNWIDTVTRKNRGFRKSGGGVIEAFYDGYRLVEDLEWEFLVKLDGDLSFDDNYFEQCFKRFNIEDNLGIAGGVVGSIEGDKLIIEKHPKFHVRGATKIYRKKCWIDIKGLIQAPGWDTVDEVKANLEGWKTRSFSDLLITHYRKTGTADGILKSNKKYGLANYICGYHVLFAIAKSIKKLVEKPYGLCTIYYLSGYFGASIKHEKQVDDQRLLDYVKREQLKKLLFQKSIWN